MNRKHALAAAAAAFLAVPAFAQTCTLSSDNLQMICPSTAILGAGPVISSNGTTITSGTGVLVTPGTPIQSVAVVPSAADVALVVPGHRVLPGASVVQASETTVLGAGPAVVAVPATTTTRATVLGAGPAVALPASSKTIVTRYWVNVPADVTTRADFQRWMRLKP